MVGHFAEVNTVSQRTYDNVNGELSRYLFTIDRISVLQVEVIVSQKYRFCERE
jgi:hypothetical protein